MTSPRDGCTSTASLSNARNPHLAAFKTTPNLPYDVCFGLLVMEASCTYAEWRDGTPSEFTPVKISCRDNVLRLRYEGSQEVAGIVLSQALPRLIREHSVTLTACLTARIGRGFTSFGDYLHVRTLRVVVYGFLSNRDAVKTILDQEDRFLQRPEDSEYDRRVRYLNPMYFTRPGEDAPRLVGRSTAGSLRQTSAASDEGPLNEIQRSQVLKIFDEATHSEGSNTLGVSQSSRIISTLKDHQINALAMMIEREMDAPDTIDLKRPSLWEPFDKDGRLVYRHIVTKARQPLPLPSLRGGILADEMGLGKTLSTLALICDHVDRLANFDTPQTTRTSRATLIVTPKSTIYSWTQQINRHIRPGGLKWLVYHGQKRQDLAAELHNKDVVLTTYDTLRSDWATYGPLYACSWARVVLDEAHKIRNPSSQIFHATCEIPAHYRWCLTGTPIQNSLDDFGSLLAFIGIPPFTTRNRFKFWISTPILSERDPSASFLTLRKLVLATCLRRTKAHPYLASTLKLPRKTERLEIIELFPGERDMYEFFKRRSYLLASKEQEQEQDTKTGSERAKKRQRTGTKRSRTRQSRPKSMGNIMILISVLRLICDHGQALLPRVALEAWQKRDEDSVGWSLLQKASEQKVSCCVCGAQTSGGDDEVQDQEMAEFTCNKHVACETCLNSADRTTLVCLECSTSGIASSASDTKSVLGSPVAPSSKVSALLKNISATIESKNLDDKSALTPKSVIFSYWTGMLDMISSALSPHISTLNLSAVRIDGSMTLQQRRDALDRFNGDKSCVIMLATIGAVGEGIDLSIASKVHIVEPQWNPMAEAQAVDRVHRIGQTSEVEVTRYCVKDSIEEYVQWVQMDKVRLIGESLTSSERIDVEKLKDEERLVEKRWEKLFNFFK